MLHPATISVHLGSVNATVPFGLEYEARISPRGEEYGGGFEGVVCSVSWLAEQFQRDDWPNWCGTIRDEDPKTVNMSGLWIMDEWSQQRFEDSIREVCRRCSPGPDWGNVASRISRVLPWEYDYAFDEHVNEHYGEPYTGVIYWDSVSPQADGGLAESYPEEITPS